MNVEVTQGHFESAVGSDNIPQGNNSGICHRFYIKDEEILYLPESAKIVRKHLHQLG